jgi:hypothetical protein
VSILDDIDTPASIPAEEVAEQLKAHLKQTYRYIVAAFTEGAQLFWTNSRGVSAAEIAAALGPQGQEIFALHWQLGQFIGALRPEAIQPGLSLVGQFEYNDDGSVTILAESPALAAPQEPWTPPLPAPEPAPEPEPEPEPEPNLPQQQMRSRPPKKKKKR